jgi:hypothetical protein
MRLSTFRVHDDRRGRDPRPRPELAGEALETAERARHVAATDPAVDFGIGRVDRDVDGFEVTQAREGGDAPLVHRDAVRREARPHAGVVELAEHRAEARMHRVLAVAREVHAADRARRRHHLRPVASVMWPGSRSTSSRRV